MGENRGYYSSGGRELEHGGEAKQARECENLKF